MISCGSCISTGAVSQTINQGQQVRAVSYTPIQHHNTLTCSFHDWKCIQHAITIIAGLSFLACILLIWVIRVI